MLIARLSSLPAALLQPPHNALCTRPPAWLSGYSTYPQPLRAASEPGGAVQ
ncbi:hypothetical protein VD0002_g10208 [Verticillium dahliae]|nr:hypothetical protein VD0004_g8236 [Verticillium dahliae]PNH49321.1 hypothetical protein VD0003_g7826 [Verticillium dahliae]PNH51950.1 hypothetical protein VD0002_g10208 [Verticillium dahliae]PNH66341.1 hypothetical protein VD0001_g8186 [Verticillium dahliae]